MANETREISRLHLLFRSMLRLGFGTGLFAAMLFLAAGSVDWPMAWVYLGLVIVGVSVAMALVVRSHPDLLGERWHAGEGVKPWDQVLSRLMSLGILLPTLLVAGLDRRWRWSPEVPLYVEVASAVSFALGTAWVSWAMASNRFFSAMVRIQIDRGHTVVTAGPYRIVRHPGYLGAIVCGIAVPLVLGSLWGLGLAAAGVGVAVLRTALEDRTLQNELAGYREYASRVRYRLIPGVW